MSRFVSYLAEEAIERDAAVPVMRRIGQSIDEVDKW